MALRRRWRKFPVRRRDDRKSLWKGEGLEITCVCFHSENTSSLALPLCMGLAHWAIQHDSSHLTQFHMHPLLNKSLLDFGLLAKPIQNCCIHTPANATHTPWLFGFLSFACFLFFYFSLMFFKYILISFF